jgi:hypothetical protein
MVEFPGATVRMGCDRFCPEERSVREVTLAHPDRSSKAVGFVL